jgi:hypothetical protein
MLDLQTLADSEWSWIWRSGRHGDISRRRCSIIMRRTVIVLIQDTLFCCWDMLLRRCLDYFVRVVLFCGLFVIYGTFSTEIEQGLYVVSNFAFRLVTESAGDLWMADESSYYTAHSLSSLSPVAYTLVIYEWEYNNKISIKMIFFQNCAILPLSFVTFGYCVVIVR